TASRKRAIGIGRGRPSVSEASLLRAVVGPPCATQHPRGIEGGRISFAAPPSRLHHSSSALKGIPGLRGTAKARHAPKLSHAPGRLVQLAVPCRQFYPWIVLVRASTHR